jgi:hypothetical protein
VENVSPQSHFIPVTSENGFQERVRAFDKTSQSRPVLEAVLKDSSIEFCTFIINLVYKDAIIIVILGFTH